VLFRVSYAWIQKEGCRVAAGSKQKEAKVMEGFFSTDWNDEEVLLLDFTLPHSNSTADLTLLEG